MDFAKNLCVLYGKNTFAAASFENRINHKNKKPPYKQAVFYVL
jgi:hypothetical protein